MGINRKGTGLDISERMQRKIARVALERMERECETNFELLSGFGTTLTRRFLVWIDRIDETERLEAALSLTCRYLRLNRIKCAAVPNYQRWTESFGASPLFSDLSWRSARHPSLIRKSVRSSIGSVHSFSSRSLDLSEENPLTIPELRTGLELNTKVADIVLLQFLRESKSLVDLSYVALLGLGPTGWRVHDEMQCAKAVAALPVIISKARELV
jgi:hypothetical protein